MAKQTDNAGLLTSKGGLSAQQQSKVQGTYPHPISYVVVLKVAGRLVSALPSQ